MATTNENEETSSKKLSEIFDTAFELFNSIQKTTESTSSLKIQLDVKKCMSLFEEATKLVSMTDLFSSNEEFEEIPTEHIQYLLLPALLGTLATKLCDRTNRLHNLQVSEIYFHDFLQRVKTYGLTNVEIPKLNPSNSEDASTSLKTSQSNNEKVEQMVNTRQSKLQRYKEQKDLQEQLEVLQKSMNNENIDEEIKRKYFCTLIKSYVLQALDELNSLAQEKEIVTYMGKMATEGGSGQGKTNRKEHIPTPKLQPIIITKNALQKKVFGAGYPSLPVMTVDEFYEKKIADGEWSAAGPAQTKTGGKCLQDMSTNDEPRQEDPEDLEKEEQIEKDNDEYLARARAMDEYKDTHKRGWGNRYNRS